MNYTKEQQSKQFEIEQNDSDAQKLFSKQMIIDELEWMPSVQEIQDKIKLMAA